MIDAGKLRKKITIKQFDGTKDAYGEPMDMVEANWDAVHSCWASIDPISGKEFYENSQSHTEITHKVRCRWFSGLKAEMRIYYGSRIFNIVSVINWEERNESYLIMCKELIE